MSVLGEMVRKSMNDQGLTQSQVARKLGIDRTTLSKYINGHIPFPDDIKNSLLEYLYSPELELAIRGTTSNNILFNKIKYEIVRNLLRARQEYSEAIDSIDRFIVNINNAEKYSELSDNVKKQFDKLLEETEDAKNASTIIDIAAHKFGADIRAKNERCLKKYIDRGYIDKENGTHLPMSTASV